MSSLRSAARTTALGSVVVGALLLGVVGAVLAAPQAGSADDAPLAEVAGLSDRLDEVAADPEVLADPEAAAEQLDLAPTGAGSLQLEGGRIAVSVLYAVRPGDADFAALAELGEVLAASSELGRASMYIAPDRLAELAALPGVAAVTEALKPATSAQGAAASTATVATTAPAAAAATAPAAETSIAASSATAATAPANCRTVPANGLTPLRADLAQALHDVDGTGITVGIISNSFDTSATAASTPEQDVAAGLLPGPGNPCGYTTPVNVLKDEPSGTDEGRGMAQVVHSIAPGAALAFAASGVDDLTMRDSILALAAAGATVIVDDIYSFTEPWFQQGPVGVAIDQVTAQGVVYLSSAGNYNNIGQEGYPSAGYALNGWDTDAYRPTDCPADVLTALGDGVYDCMDFAPPVSDGGSGTPDPTSTLGLGATEAPVTWAVQWAEPYGFAKALFTLVVTRPDGTVEVLDDGNGPIPVTAGGFRPVVDGAYHFSIVRNLTAGPDAAITPAIKWIWAFHQDIVAAEYYGVTAHDRVGAAITGHTGLPSVISVAAVPSSDTSAVEEFSSPGPVRLFYDFDPAISPMPVPYGEAVAVAKPDLASVDRIHTNFFSDHRPLGDGVFDFWGTSAAAPSAAGVVALGRQYAPQLAPDAIREALLATTVPVAAASSGTTPTDAAGAGLIDATAFLALLPTPTPTPVPVPAADGSTQLAATGTPLASLAPWALLTLTLGAATLTARLRPRSTR